MAGTGKIIEGMRTDMKAFFATMRRRSEELAERVEALEKRLDAYDKPAKEAKAKGKKRPVPVPNRPPVMEAAGVGKDPR